MKNETMKELRQGFETAYINGALASNLEYKPSFVSNNLEDGKKVSIRTDCMKDLANDMDPPIKRLKRWWNPFQRIRREYRIRRMFAQEMVSGHWFITTAIEGKNHKCMLVPIDEFNDLYERLKNCLENYESTHHLNKTGGWWSNY